MEPSQQQHHQLPRHPLARKSFNNSHSPSHSLSPLKTAPGTPMSSGLFNPSASRQSVGQISSFSESNTPAPHLDSPYLHPLQTYQVRETHKALIDSDLVTGRKSINQYEVIEEIGRGMHGKVKLARNLESGDNVAIKIIPRFSKKRRLGKVTAMSPQDKTKKEIAILKKIRHPNVVALLEVIDDPELKKIYMVLEHVELGEIVWRKKGLPHICHYERKRIEREMRGEAPSAEEELYERMLERRQAVNEAKRAKMAQNYPDLSEFWSVEHGAAEDASISELWSRMSSKENVAVTDTPASQPISRRSSIARSQQYSVSPSVSGFSGRPDDASDWNEDSPTPGPLQPVSSAPVDSAAGAAALLEEDLCYRHRSPSLADSIISHMSSIDYNLRAYDPFADDFSYVPCFTTEQARSAFRDTVLGLEYLHYQGVVHRDIKPANLLWSKDHRVKISDFGVSYFGRPIRDGELDDLVSESEAKDFDDDLELSKTVGTPAFFAPELCYTDPDKKELKVSEQIDVWSLGVTLYCLIFARIPFLAEDEYQMFRKIANDDVYIPRRRLKPVDPSTSPTATSLYKRQNSYPYRNDKEYEYEDIDDQLYDLLFQMLAKNPEKRIRLKDIKRHPWVLQGLSNPIAWLEDTDPARPTSGRKIQVDEKEMSSAVIPLTFLERARSVVKKAVGKVINPLMDRDGSRSRRRATSSAASSVGDSMFKNAPAIPQTHNERRHNDGRRSLYPDDHSSNRTEEISPGETYSTSSMIAVAPSDAGTYDPMATLQPRLKAHGISPARQRGRSDDIKASHHHHSTAFVQPFQRGQQNQQQFLRLSPYLSGPHTLPGTPVSDGHHNGDHYSTHHDLLGMAMSPKSQEQPQADRSLFHSEDKRGSPRVSLDTTAAPGSVSASRHNFRSLQYTDFGRHRFCHSLSSSPLSSSPQSHLPSYEHQQPNFDSNYYGLRPNSSIGGRPVTAHRVDKAENEDEASDRLAHPHHGPSTIGDVRVASMTHSRDGPVDIPRPNSHSKHSQWYRAHASSFSRGETMASVKTASSGSIDRLGTPLTSPSEATSPVAAHTPTKSTSGQMSAFQSDPSLPALLSGASSISADIEGELLGRPGIISGQPLLETTDSMTPPALTKEPATGLDQVLENPPMADGGSFSMQLGSNRPSSTQGWQSSSRRDVDDEDDDGDGSDDGIFIMARSTRKRPPVVFKGPRFEVKRRDTNYSTASDETAKKVAVDGDKGASQSDAV